MASLSGMLRPGCGLPSPTFSRTGSRTPIVGAAASSSHAWNAWSTTDSRMAKSSARIITRISLSANTSNWRYVYGLMGRKKLGFQSRNRSTVLILRCLKKLSLRKEISARVSSLQGGLCGSACLMFTHILAIWHVAPLAKSLRKWNNECSFITL